MSSKLARLEEDLAKVKHSLRELGLDDATIDAKWNEYLKNASMRFKDEFVIKKRALANLKRLLYRVSKLHDVVGLCIGVSPKIDLIALMRKKAQLIWEQNPERAISEGITDEEGNPLDYRPTIFGRENPNFGKPLPEDAHEYRRSYYFLNANGEIIELQARDEQTKLVCEVGKWYKFKASLRGKDESRGLIQMRTSVLTDFVEIVNPPDLDLAQALESHIEPLEDGLNEADFFVSKVIVVRKGKNLLVVDDVEYYCTAPEVIGFYEDYLAPIVDQLNVGDVIYVLGRGRKFEFEGGIPTFSIWGVGKWQ